jgi:hypothetical protein
MEKCMKLLIPTVLAAALLAGSVMADDSMGRATPSKHQALKDCIEKQKTADVNMSKSQMERLCKDEIKRQKVAGDTPPADAPRAP